MEIPASNLTNAMIIIGANTLEIGEGYIDLKGYRLEQINQLCLDWLSKNGFGYVPWLFCWRYPKERIP